MRLVALLALAAAASHAAPPLTLDAAKAGLDARKLARIPARLQVFVDSGAISGAVTLAGRHGAVAHLEAVGYHNLDAKQPMRTDAIFQLHSMTKPIVCAALLTLAEEGRVSLSDPVENYLPEFRGQWVRDGEHLRRPARRVTIRDLMTHTSGMIGNPPAAIGELHGKLHVPLDAAVAIFAQQPLLFDPGTKWLYSNTGIAAVARILEVASGKPFVEAMEERILKPLGMNETWFYPPERVWPRVAGAYILNGGKSKKYTADPLGEGDMRYRKGAKYPLPEGGLYATAADLNAFCQMMLNRGTYRGVRVLSQASVRLATANHTGELRTGGAGAGWGLGWSVLRDASGALSLQSPGTWSHGGRYGTYFWMDPNNDLYGVFLIQREGGSEERNAFVELVYAAMTE